jgi:hypothetical protein
MIDKVDYPGSHPTFPTRDADVAHQGTHKGHGALTKIVADDGVVAKIKMRISLDVEDSVQ